MISEANVTTDSAINSGSQFSALEKRPIFILGILPRTGTNFLYNLLCLHPDCQKSLVNEDYFVYGLNHLVQYVKTVTDRWALMFDWSFLHVQDTLSENLGQGLINALRQIKRQAADLQAAKLGFELPEKVFDKRLVTKTPYVKNLNDFFSFFPSAQLLIIVRDGRALVESNVKTFDFTYEDTIRSFVKAARIIENFEQQFADRKHDYLIVHYEDLHLETAREMRKILDFLGLNSESYDFKAMLEVPVVGSSTTKDTDGKVHWRPIKKTAEFNPLARAAGWSRAQHERFNWLATEEMKMLGYKPQVFPGNRFYWNARNQLVDFKLKINELLTYSTNLFERIQKKFGFIGKT